MRAGVCLLLFGVVAAVLGLASARASAAETTTTTGTTTAATTTTTTTTTATTSYAPLAVSSLPAGCVGAGVAAVVPPSHPAVALGSPASDLGPSGYPASASTVAISSSTTSGSTCRSATITLASVSLFEGAVTASSIEATGGTGAVAGLEIDGTAVAVGEGRSVAVENWGQLTLGEKVGRLLSPLVIRLVQAHDGLAAGTRIALAFAAAPEPRAKASKRHRTSATTHGKLKANAGSHRHAKRGSKKNGRQPAKSPPDFPASPYPFLISGALPDAAQDNPVVSIAMRYLNVPYQWGGASPKTGFDCSGLVSYVFGQLGVSLPHYAASQWHSPDTVWIPPNRLQPGDLVFFTGSDGTRKAPGHVGIYVGDGYLIDAPHTGAFVQIDSLKERWFANQYVGARKIVSPLHKPRHLLSETTPEVSAGVSFLGLPSPMAIEPLGQPLSLAAAAVPARAVSRAYWIVACIAASALLVLLATGGILVRRHRSADATSSSEALN